MQDRRMVTCILPQGGVALHVCMQHYASLGNPWLAWKIHLSCTAGRVPYA